MINPDCTYIRNLRNYFHFIMLAICTLTYTHIHYSCFCSIILLIYIYTFQVSPHNSHINTHEQLLQLFSLSDSDHFHKSIAIALNLLFILLYTQKNSLQLLSFHNSDYTLTHSLELCSLYNSGYAHTIFSCFIPYFPLYLHLLIFFHTSIPILDRHDYYHDIHSIITDIYLTIPFKLYLPYTHYKQLHSVIIHTPITGLLTP